MYTPDAIPDDAPTGLKAWLATQLRLIANALSAPSVRTITVQPGAEPARPTEGMVAYFSNKLRVYEGGAWRII